MRRGLTSVLGLLAAMTVDAAEPAGYVLEVQGRWLQNGALAPLTVGAGFRRSVYPDLGPRPQLQTRETELAALQAVVGAVLVLAAAALSPIWIGRIA